MTEAPRVALFADTFHEINGAAKVIWIDLTAGCFIVSSFYFDFTKRL